MKTFICIAVLLITSLANAQSFDSLKDKDELTKQEGFFDFWYSQKEDKIYLQVNRLDQEFIYVNSLTSGLGSNDIGLDRGKLGNTAIVKFQRAGNKLLLMQPNQDFRANTSNELERRSVEEAFAKSVVFGFDILEENENAFLIDFTPFLMRDAYGVSKQLKRQKQGTYKLDQSKSALAMQRTKTFPKNTEFEALLTFTGDAEGRNIRSVAPDASNLSVIQHHSLVQLPDEGYQKREFDPRSGANFISYQDYATPIFEPLTKRYITRHRLEKKNPEASLSEAKAPIIYYLDPGTPEPVRSALLEGAQWWDQAFEALGYKNAFQVRMLPADADPMDLRYNMIQWVHRSTRGWSYGMSIVDPRTGEILKGHVSLGSLRIRQDFMIAQALMNRPFAASDENYKPMLDMALARIRQLSAHEVGHTLGFAHNFAASTNADASVMDYPHPNLRLEENQIDFSKAYDTNIGEWDKVTVAYSYGAGDTDQTEKEYLESVLKQARDEGLQFISDADARAQGGAHAYAHLWDNGREASEELNRVLELRQTAISHFSEDNIRTGEAYSVLEDVFVPLYFFHRYQTEATVKLIGGLDYNYATKGSNLKVVEMIPKQEQKKALEATLKTLDAETLAIPKRILDLFPPRAFGYSRNRESFKSNTGVSFDALGAAATASDMSLGLLLHPERANRLVQQHALEDSNLGLEKVLQELVKNSFRQKHSSDYLTQVQNTINFNVLKHVMNLSASDESIPQVKALANKILAELKDRFSKDDSAITSEMHYRIEQFMEDPEEFEVIPSPAIPDGSPIGSFQCLNE
ncbi:zinc-dependent metalloprotease [Psychroflexus sp. YR1-1]|uniref:Zinc-dependent metalloprotease n=1 Tax=Psychroflexus aurantiacus TaxID=2709310 RepID=A0A6B3R8N1_9FLAO|nr:zinc-dependent metalloprotease [Psychroflexus aurantiacus]NEV93981.1 zinc-dependent metalloprotease [Psychroflexus aurantiacus]